jgi:hypothetical protein
MYINYNNAVINNYGRFQNYILLFKTPKCSDKISFNFIDNLGTRPKKFRQSWTRSSG